MSRDLLSISGELIWRILQGDIESRDWEEGGYARLKESQHQNHSERDE